MSEETNINIEDGTEETSSTSRDWTSRSLTT